MLFIISSIINPTLIYRKKIGERNVDRIEEMLFVKFSIYNPTIVYRKDCYNVVCKVFYIQSNNYI